MDIRFLGHTCFELTDGDTRVDHWDRDAAWRQAQEAAQAQSATAAQD